MNLNELAAALGVSPASISIVRRGRAGVSPATRRRIQQALDENGFTYLPYTPGEVDNAPKPAAQNRHILLLKYYDSGLLVNKNEGFVDSIISVIDSTIQLNDYTLVVNTVSKADFGRYLNAFVSEAWAGVLVIATEMSREEILQLSRITVPVVILDSDYPALPFSSVSMDNRSLAYTAVEHLSARGEVGHIVSRVPTGNFAARESGYREALRCLGLPLRDNMFFPVTPSLSGAYEDMRVLLASGRRVPPALFAANDIIAIGAIKALIEAGYRVPQDTAVIGVDNTLLAQISTPPLSSLHVSRSALGRSAIRQLLLEIEDISLDPTQLRVASRLILREST